MKRLSLLALAIVLLFATTATAQDWQIIPFQLDATLTGVTFVHRDTGFVVSADGSWARTADAGQTWHKGSIDPTVKLEDISFLNGTTGLVCGSRGSLYLTTDGGSNWQDVSSGDTAHIFFDIEWLAPQIALAIGADRSAKMPITGVAFRSTDGGLTWKKLEPMGIGYSEICVRADGAVYFPSFNQLLRSNNQGRTWTRTSTFDKKQARALSLYGKTGLMAGPGGMCAISNDSGKTWTMVTQTESSTFVTAELIDEQSGYIGGPNSMMMYTTDSGQTWKQELLPISFHILDMCRIDNRVYAVGSDGTITYKKLK
ncbi:MAG: hypothetical protein KOO62_02495 [candidate division Zixibacteria bacterium]|nr:hypothetical protein [candidate division Zixibacteria bacterium]